jgi:hypothetical protein
METLEKEATRMSTNASHLSGKICFSFILILGKGMWPEIVIGTLEKEATRMSTNASHLSGILNKGLNSGKEQVLIEGDLVEKGTLEKEATRSSMNASYL